MDRHEARELAQRYIGNTDPLEDLGHGAGGYVFGTRRATAVKVPRHAEAFERELAAYLRFQDLGVDSILGLAVPTLVGSDRSLRVIEISIVQPPYLLDFAQTRLDAPLEFPDDEWWERVREAFGEKFERAQDVFYELQNSCGIYYYDLAPRNVNFGG